MDEREITESLDKKRLDGHPEKWYQNEHPPETVDNAWNRRKQFDHERERPLEPWRGKLRKKNGDPETERERDDQREHRRQNGAGDERQCAVFILHRIPDGAGEKFPAEFFQREGRSAVHLERHQKNKKEHH